MNCMCGMLSFHIGTLVDDPGSGLPSGGRLGNLEIV